MLLFAVSENTCLEKVCVSGALQQRRLSHGPSVRAFSKNLTKLIGIEADLQSVTMHAAQFQDLPCELVEQVGLCLSKASHVIYFADVCKYTESTLKTRKFVETWLDRHCRHLPRPTQIAFEVYFSVEWLNDNDSAYQSFRYKPVSGDNLFRDYDEVHLLIRLSAKHSAERVVTFVVDRIVPWMEHMDQFDVQMKVLLPLTRAFKEVAYRRDLRMMSALNRLYDACLDVALKLEEEATGYQACRWNESNRYASKEASKSERKIQINAASRDDVQMMDWFVQRDFPVYKAPIVNAAITHLCSRVVRYLFDSYPSKIEFDAAVVDQLACVTGGRGKLMLELLHDVVPPSVRLCSQAAMDGATKNGNIEIVRFLHQNRSEGCTKKAMNEAARYGHLDVIRFLQRNRTEGCTRSAMNNASQHGHLSVVEFLCNHYKNVSRIPEALRAARKKRQWHVVEFLQRQPK